MKTLAFLDCPTGISGDMCLGALVDAGVPLAYLEESLARLSLPESYHLQAIAVQRHGLAATHVQVQLAAPSLPRNTPDPNPSHTPDRPHHRHDPHLNPHPHRHGDPHHAPADHRHTAPHAHPHAPQRHLKDILALLDQADLPAKVRQWSRAIFQRLAIAEGAVHGIDPAQVHFHEVGATDAIVDIVGTCLGLDWLGVEALYCGPLPVGAGTVRAVHGRLPVPAPAVLKLLEQAQVPIYSNGLWGELVTPTGAAIATTLAQGFGDPPAMVLKRVGLGAGRQDLAIPNVLRLWLGEAPGGSLNPLIQGQETAIPAPARPASPPLEASQVVSPGFPTDTVVELTTQIDDLSPQAFGYVSDRLFQAGALDVFTQGITMKKSRPGHLLTVIAPPEQADACSRLIFTETTTLGIRCQPQQRQYLRRSYQAIATPYGSVTLKVAHYPDGTPLKAHPEYEDCVRLAQVHEVSWQQIHHHALGQWYQRQFPSP